jgi:23S rRNA-/tRNA-specific pseudouridylate synthase
MTFDPSRILFHGGGLLAVDKPAGVPVHRGTSHEQGLAEMIDEWASLAPGAIDLGRGKSVLPLHRLDREASGVVLFGLSRSTARAVQTAFAARQVRKRYLAVVAGPVEEAGRIHGKVRSRLRGVYRWLPAELTYRRLEGDERLSLVEVHPEEGRTHQIRALFAEAGRPLAGDLRYGKPRPARQFLEKFGLPCLLLHAAELELMQAPPGLPRSFAAPLPEEFRRLAEKKGWSTGPRGN